MTRLSGCAHSYVLTFVMVTILSAMDFWTVKNVSGRLLVGLRWWNDVDEAGQNHWRFESFEARGRPPPPPSVPEAVAAPPCRVPPRRVCVCVCVPLLLAGAAIHPPDRQQLLLGRALRGARLLGDPRFLRPHHLQGHVGPAHLCAGRRPKRQLATPERPLPLPSTTPTTQPPPTHPAGVAFTCSAINVVGYVKCKKDARKKLSALGGSVMLKGMEMWGSRKGASSSGA